MYLNPIEKQNDAKRQRHPQNHEEKMYKQTLPINQTGIKIVKDDFTGRLHGMDEKQCSSQRTKPSFQTHVASKAARPNELRKEFPHRGKSVDWCNVQNRWISSREDYSYREEPKFEEDQITNLQAQYLYKNNRCSEQKDANLQNVRQSEYEMKNCSSRKEDVEKSSSSSRRVNADSRESCEEHHKSLHTTAASTTAGYRSGNRQRYIQYQVFSRVAEQRLSGRRSNTPADKEQWVKSELQGQQDLRATSTNARNGKKIKAEDYQRAKLRLKSQKLDQNSDSESLEVEQEKQCTYRGKSQRTNISIFIPTLIPVNIGKSKCSRPSATRNMATSPSDRCIQLDNHVRLETEKYPHMRQLATDSEGQQTDGLPSSTIIRKARLQEYGISKYNNRRREIPQTPLKKDYSTHHPCYILDNIRMVLSYLSVLEVIRSQQVAKIWKTAARSILNNRTSYDITINPPSTPKMGGTLIQGLEVTLPRLQRLTLSLSDFKNIEGPMPFFILKHICGCQNLVFLRIERFTWELFQWAVNKILLYTSKGHPIMSTLQVLELPNTSLPIQTSTECMEPLSHLTPILRSLTLNSALDPVIFSLRLFMPSVKKLFLLNALYTTQRFAQIVTSSPILMKHLMNNHADDNPRTPMLTASKNKTSAGHISKPEGSIPIISTSSRVLTPGSEPVPINDERLTPLVACHNKPLTVVPLGSVYQIETGHKLSKGMLQKFASFCALIGSLIIMPPQDDHSIQKRE